MPTVAEALQIGWQRHQAGQVRAAEQVYRQVLQAAPKDANAWCFLGMACHDLGRYDEAADAYREALRIQPEFPVALSNFGNTLKSLGRYDEAVARCHEALRIKPNYATAYNNLGAVLVAKGDLTGAREALEAAARLTPQDAVTRANLGAALVRQGDFAGGVSHAEQALQINPRHADAHKNLAIVWLLMGDFERGWPKYEWRWQCLDASLPSIHQPRWDGASLAGRTILLWAEQGLGDSIHFIRYARQLADQGASVVFAAPPPLLKLLARCPGIDRLVPKDGPYPAFDVWSPLLSVPGLVETTLATIPAEVPYLSADPQLVDAWRERLAAHPGFRIGIVWQGSPGFHADPQRSIPLRHFAPLARIPGVRLISLQKGHGAEQIAALNGAFEVVDFGDELDSASGPFMDSAAIIKNLDLIVTSDTALPHLAGALAAPTWTVLSVSPDWRWLLNRDDSPWYPAMRLFRQQTLGDWDEVFRRVAAEVHALIDSRVPSLAGSTHPSSETEFTMSQPSAKATVTVEIAPGELIDKMTILEIKLERIADEAKRRNVAIELDVLRQARDATLEASDALAELTARLKAINEQLWDIEDDIRDCERDKDFGPRFVELARSVYKSNDRRAALKREINELLGSQLVEEKSYAEYE